MLHTALALAIEQADYAPPVPAGVDTDDNGLRADRATVIALAYEKATQQAADNEDQLTIVADLLSDLAHLVHRITRDADDAATVFAHALGMYRQELAEATPDDDLADD